MTVTADGLNLVSGVIQLGTDADKLLLNELFLTYFGSHIHSSGGTGPPQVTILPQWVTSSEVKAKGGTA